MKSGLFDHIFVHSNACKEELIKRNWVERGKISVLLNCFDEDIHKKFDNVRKDIDIAFVGNVTPRRKIIFDKLARKFNTVIKSVYKEEMVEIFNRSKIILNVHAEEFLDTETRMFEALGCGVFVLSEKLSDDNPFIAGEHYIEVNNLAELESMIEFY